MLLFNSEKPGETIAEWAIIELQGDLQTREDSPWSGQFVGDLHYTKSGQPILIIGHHILQGKEMVMDKPFAVLEKNNLNEDNSQVDSSQTPLNSTFAVEQKLSNSIEYLVKAIVKKKIIFKIRPKPIISNVLNVI